MLPENAIKVETIRQRLLAQHDALVQRVRGLSEGSREDIRMLARLWQLQQKMESVRRDAGGWRCLGSTTGPDRCLLLRRRWVLPRMTQGSHGWPLHGGRWRIGSRSGSS